MASTPLYKSLKPNGTSFYAFPGAAEDISAAYQNSNYKMSFNKYVLLNFPKQNTISGTLSVPTYFDFDQSFSRSNIATPATNYKDAMIESLRNYVANNEVVIRESRLNNTKYYYDTNALETTTEKIFFKWCRKLKVIDFEPAIPGDEYDDTLSDFSQFVPNNDEYFPENLWKEREVSAYNALSFYQTPNAAYTQNLEIEFSGTTNFRVGDLVNIYDVLDTNIINEINSTEYYDMSLGFNTTVLDITPAGVTQGQLIVFDIQFLTDVFSSEPLGKVEIVYHRLVQYIGEITGVSNVQEANRAYTEIYAHIPDHTGKTPDILFRTMVDNNYKPNMTFPILPSQFQPEIMGAELFNSPIVSSPQNYPGSQYGQFDTADYTYETSTGDDLRRSGDYFGITGDKNNPVTDGSKIDGITMNFNKSHYSKMNSKLNPISNFDQFNALSTNNKPPKDFEFNAILWYYSVEDSSGNIRTNLYGVSFLDNPDNNQISDEVSIRFPLYKKLVSNGNQDGTSYAFSLNLNFNIINENTNLAYNPEAINSLFSMNLFNESMKRLASVNDSFQNIISEQSFFNEEIMNLKSLLYTQTDINVLNSKIQNLENLLRLYSRMQIQDSESIVATVLPGSPPSLSFQNVDTQYVSIINALTSDMYNEQGSIPLTIPVALKKNFLLNITNNDEVNLQLPNSDKLVVVIDRDLHYKQSFEINIYPNEFASENKKLDIYLRSDYVSVDNPTEILMLGDIDLPVSYNSSNQLSNSSYLWKDFKFDIDINESMSLLTDNKLLVPFSSNSSIINNSIKEGDVFALNNFFVGTSSVYDFSGQYIVDSLVGPTSSSVIFDLSNNPSVVSYGASQSLPLELNSASYSILSNYPYFSLNKGKKIKIVRISDSTIITERYYIEVNDIM